MGSERPHTAESSSRCQAGVESRRWPQMLGPSRSVLIRAALDLAACDRGEVSCGLSVGPLWTFTYHPVAGIDVTPSTVEVTFADPVALATNVLDERVDHSGVGRTVPGRRYRQARVIDCRVCVDVEVDLADAGHSVCLVSPGRHAGTGRGPLVPPGRNAVTGCGHRPV